MKRPVNFFDGLVLIGVLLMLTGWGPGWLTWGMLVIPWAIEGVVFMILIFDKISGFSDGLLFRIFKPFYVWQFKRKAEKAKEATLKMYSQMFNKKGE